MEGPNQEETLQIQELREKLRVNNVSLNNEQISDPYLLRWIRAGGQDLVKAEEMLMNTLKWRQENGVDFILDTNPMDPFFLQNFPFWVDSVDKMGHPVVEIAFGIWDVTSVSSSPSLQLGYRNFLIHFYERIMGAIKEVCYSNPYRPWPVTQWTCIVDFKGYSTDRLLDEKTLQTHLELSKIFQKNYPETVYKCYCINLPATYPLYLAMISKIHDKRTIEKIQYYYDEKKWKAVLKEEIGEDQLGHMYGGKKVRMVGDKVFNYDQET